MVSSISRDAGSTPEGVVIGVGYLIDGNQVTWGTVDGPLASGASVTVPTTGGSWTATSGEHTLTAVVDDINRKKSHKDILEGMAMCCFLVLRETIVHRQRTTLEDARKRTGTSRNPMRSNKLGKFRASPDDY